MKTTRSILCSEVGCNEYAHYRYDSQKEAREADARRGPWKCTRHSNPDRVLSEDNLFRETELVCSEVLSLDKKQVIGSSWGGTSGFVYGTGYCAYSKDFPIGTRLVISARIILPEPPKS